MFQGVSFLIFLCFSYYVLLSKCEMLMTHMLNLKSHIMACLQTLFWFPRVILCQPEMTVHSPTLWLWSRRLAASVAPVGRSAFGCSGCYPRSLLNCLLLTQLSKRQVPHPWHNIHCSLLSHVWIHWISALFHYSDFCFVSLLLSDNTQHCLNIWFATLSSWCKVSAHYVHVGSNSNVE